MELRTTVLLQQQDELLFCFTIEMQCQPCSFACDGFLCMGVLPSPLSLGSGQPDSSRLGGYLMLICVYCFRCSPWPQHEVRAGSVQPQGVLPWGSPPDPFPDLHQHRRASSDWCGSGGLVCIDAARLHEKKRKCVCEEIHCSCTCAVFTKAEKTLLCPDGLYTQQRLFWLHVVMHFIMKLAVLHVRGSMETLVMDLLSDFSRLKVRSLLRACV